MADITIGGRLREALTECAMSLAALSDKAGLVYSSVQNYAADRQSPGAEALTKIARATGINIHWLLTGEGESFFRPVLPLSREITMRDYQKLRTLFSNFDDVFTVKNPWIFADVKEKLPELEAQCWRTAILFTAKSANIDLGLFLDGRNLETMSNEELRDVAMNILKFIQPRQ